MRWLHRLAPVLSVLVIGAIAVAASYRPSPGQAEPFHARVRQAVQDMPPQVGDWIGVDTEIPDAAIKLLRPNARRCRVFRNLRTGETATLLVVQCSDARDLAGHYPAICYPAEGWQIVSEKPYDWRVGGMDLTGTRYVMHYPHPTAPRTSVVANFMIMPDGRVLRGMKGVYDAAADYTMRFFGAAEIQVVVSADLSEKEQDRIIDQILAGHTQLLRVLGSAHVHGKADAAGRGASAG